MANIVVRALPLISLPLWILQPGQLAPYNLTIIKIIQCSFNLLSGWYRHNDLTDLLQLFIEKGFDVNVNDGVGWTPLLQLYKNNRHDHLIHWKIFGSRKRG